MKRYSYGERDYTFGQMMLTLRTNIGLTQAGLAEQIGRSAAAARFHLRAIRGGDSGDRIRLVHRNGVDPFDLNALPTRDLDGWPWQ
jgi:hypothetical protein